MAKVTQVTNSAEHVEMMDRIVKCSIEIAKPSTSVEKRAEYHLMYDDMVLKVQRYQRMTYIQKWPDLVRVYKELGWEYDEPTGVREPEPAAENYSKWLED